MASYRSHPRQHLDALGPLFAVGSSGEIVEGSVVKFVVSDCMTNGMLPVIDMGVREMVKGETCRLTAPTHWAYTAPEYVHQAEGGAAGPLADSLEGAVEHGHGC